MKQCTRKEKCVHPEALDGGWLSATPEYFFRDKSRVDGLYPSCKVCTGIWASQNPEKKREHRRLSRRNNPDNVRDSKRRDRQKHPEKHHARQQRYQRNHPEKGRASSHRRRARKKLVVADFTTGQWEACIAYFGGCCAACGRPPGLWHTLSQDHWIPLIDGGGYTAKNIIPLCYGEGGCNNSKNSRNALEWLKWRFGEPKALKILAGIEAYFASLPD